MVFTFSTKLHLAFPLTLFNTEHFCLKNQFINIKYIFLQPSTVSFIKAIKYINNIYSISVKLSKRIKKSNVISRNNLSNSTRKPWQQKGLGRARSGSFKSPLWKGGSVLFGPKSKTLFIMLQKKNKKLSFFYLLLNKRTYISFAFLAPIIHNFNNITEYLHQQKRIKGLFSNKLIYVLLNNVKHITNNKFPFIYINSLSIISFLQFDYIIFLI